MKKTPHTGLRAGVSPLLFACLASLLLGACSRDAADQRSVARMSAGVTKSEYLVAEAAGNRAARDNSTLAYEHNVTIELSKELLPTRVRELQAACATDREFNCTLLDVSTSEREEMPSGSVRVRLAPAGTQHFIDMAAKDGHVTNRNTHAEDLAEPVADTEREISQLTTHRDRLAEFMKNKDIKIDQLITVSRELATVQTQLDEVNNRHANLHRRINTELLSISLVLPMHDYNAEPHPVRDALHAFASDFRQAIAHVIRFIAVLLPWLVIIVPGLILLRLFWRWIGRWLMRREQRGK
jgi:hypothetical protein